MNANKYNNVMKDYGDEYDGWWCVGLLDGDMKDIYVWLYN